MIIGLTGYHRTGKSTLAKTLGKTGLANEFPIHTYEVFLALGINLKEPREPVEILALQHALYNYVKKQLSELHLYPTSTYVIDRSPVDYAAYTLMLLRGTKYELEAAELADKFMKLNAMIDKVVLLNPGIEVQDAQKSFTYDITEANEYTDLMRSLGLTLGNDFIEIPAGIINLYSRVGYVQTTLELFDSEKHKQVELANTSMLQANMFIPSVTAADLCQEITLPSYDTVAKKSSN